MATQTTFDGRYSAPPPDRGNDFEVDIKGKDGLTRHYRITHQPVGWVMPGGSATLGWFAWEKDLRGEWCCFWASLDGFEGEDGLEETLKNRGKRR
jgi:hypothetical protein